MSERGRNIAVGVTFIVGLACLGVILLKLGYLHTAVRPEKGYHVLVIVPSTGGLEIGSQVKRGGYPIGRVDQIDIEQDPPFQVKVGLFLWDWVQIPQGVKTRVEAPIFGGTPALELDASALAGQTQPTYLSKDGTAVIHGESGSLAGNIQGTITQAEQRFAQVADDFKAASQSFQQLSAQWQTVGQNVNQLIEPRNLADVDAGKVPGNLTTAVERTDQRLKEMQKTIDGINAFVNDQQLHNDIRQSAANIRQVSESVKSVTGKVDSLMDNTGKAVDRLSTRYFAVADDMSKAANTVQQTIQEAGSGNGTMGKLVHDPQLYNNLADSAERLKDALGEVKTLVEKIRKEGLAVKY